MRAVKIAAAVMAVLIVLGTTVLVVALFKRASAPAAMATAAVAVMDEPAGTGIVSIAAAGDRLAVQLHGGGPDRVVFVDPRTATVAGRISLSR
jgi:archaellum component FlaG (FlaF/FlaG flagellin family)